jgi:SAM-dependent methyltransferase
MNTAEVYNNISKDFDKTRFSVWRGVREFLDTLPTDSSLCEAGCGNGKNLLYRSDLVVKGYDLSIEMVKICQDKGLDVEEGDITKLKDDNDSFNNVISVAVIHHLPTRELRIKAISELLRIVKTDGKVLITVWAYEQSNNSRRKFDIGDNLVPFLNSKGENIYRFYHVYIEGELESEINDVKHLYKDVKVYWELGNWCVIITKI